MLAKTKIRVDLVVVLAMVILAIPISFAINAKFLTSTLLFFGVPSIYLLFRQKRQLKRVITGSVLFGVFYGFLLDYMAELNGAWAWAGNDQLIFPYKIFGVVNIDVMIWFFFWVFFMIIFYEHFLEHDRKSAVSPNIKYGIIPPLVGFAIIGLSNLINPDLLRFGYAYLVLGIATLPFFVYVIKKKPILLIKFLKASLFFVLLYLAYEITAFYLNQWNFPGKYVGTVTVLGASFPFEEFVVWILLSSSVVLSYYELFIDDFK